MSRRPQTRRLALLALLVLLTSACQITFGPRPGPQATRTPTPAGPTTTPLPLPPPRLLERTPAPGAEQPLEAPLTFTFDQPMDPASVEAALVISPTVAGTLDWLDARTLTFTPKGGLARATRYQVIIQPGARSAAGTPLAEPLRFDFSTVGYLAVSEVQPAPGTQDLSPETRVTVVFNRPVVPLTAIQNQAGLPQPLTFEPPVSGQGEWLNTSIYVFRPEPGFQPATAYTARVSAALQDTLGNPLAEDYVWTFSTFRPKVQEFRPRDKFRYVGPTATITVTFNQPVDHASAEAAFSLKTGDTALAGTFRWSGGREITDTETLVFVPNAPLPRNSRFQALVAAGVRARAGSPEVGMAKDLTWSFQTVNDPGILSFYPADGATDVDVYGDVVINFASPMATDVFTQHLTLTPPITDVYVYWSEYNTEARIYFPRRPNSSYSVALDAATPDQYGAPLGQALRLRFTTGDLPPDAYLNTGSRLGTFGVTTDTVIYATTINVTQLDVALYRLPVEQFMLFNGYGDWEAWERYKPAESTLVRRWSEPINAPRNEYQLVRLALTDAQGQELPPGLYYVQMQAPEVLQRDPKRPLQRYMFIKSRLNLTLMQSRYETLVWATDLATGQPAGGLPVRFNAQHAGWHNAGQTNAQGLYVAPASPTGNLWDPYFAFVGEPGERDFAVAGNGWDNGISPWNFNVSADFDPSPYRGQLYTDRPIYRPGQTVYFKGIVRADDDAHYLLPTALQTVTVTIQDPQGKEIYHEPLALNDMGTFHGEIALDAEAALGDYYINASSEKENYYSGISFQVAEYRKPEYQVSVTTDRPAYFSGDTLAVTGEATYYFGGPVANAAVRWSALSDDYTFTYDCPAGQSCPWYSWGEYEWDWYFYRPEYGGYGRLLAQGEAQTDAQGRVTFQVPADLSTQKSSQRFTLEVSVTDLNGQEVSNRTTTVVHKGEFYIGVAARGYLSQVGKEKPVDILVVRPPTGLGEPAQPVAGQSLTVVFLKEAWYNVQKQAEDGRFYWDWVRELMPVFTTTATTDADGKAVAAFTPEEAGVYRARVTGVDQRGNEIRSSAHIWVWGGREFVSWQRESTNRITLIPDKREYQVGEVAEILIPSPYSGTVQALITIERGHLLQTEVRALKSNSEVVRIPILPEYAPNVFVSVVIVQGSAQAADQLASFKMGLLQLPVSVADKALRITLQPDKEMAAGQHYGPRQQAVYDITVTDAQGHPVEAELSLRLADLAVLALADERGPSLLETFWSQRGLGIRTSLPLVIAMEPLNRELAARAKGGGGGGDEAGGFVRTNFADTAFWDPVVRTDANGKARVVVTLPDNLTTWRMQAKGITADTLVGRTDVDVLSTLDLLVRPVLPRFLIVGDQAQIGAIIHNNSAEPQTVQVKLTTEGLAVAEAQPTLTVNIPAGDKSRIDWNVTALPGEQVKVKIEARAGTLYDGREDTLPVYRYSTPEVVATAGRISTGPDARLELVQLPRVFDPTQGELTVQLDGSLTAATQDALDYLKHYPYECTEQTVSRFLPNVVTYEALKELGIERPELEASLKEQVSIALQRLYANQHYDGGWGWWTADDSHPYLTAYVLHGLLEARRAGFTVDEKVLANGADFLRNRLPSVGDVQAGWQANRLAYQLYVLAEYNTVFNRAAEGELGVAINLYEKRHLLSRYGQATLALALSRLEPAEPSRQQTLVAELSSAAVASATGTHWEEATPDYWNMNTDIRTTAIVLWSLSQLKPESELLPNAVRWLMTVRKEGHWSTTQDTAWSLLGLVAYMRASGELQGDFSYRVYLNDTLLGKGDVTPETIDESRRLQVEIAKLLVEEGNRLVIERLAPTGDQTGKGQLYYTAYLRYFLPVEEVKALERGIIVARQYTPLSAPTTTVTTARVGDVIKVRLTVVAPTDLYYVVVEDPLPAGFEGVDLSLKTTSVVGEAPELHNLSAEAEDYWLRWYGWGWWWFSHTEMRDEKVALFATYLPRGTYEYTYLIRASVPGTYQVLPTTASQMYFPEVFGRSDGAIFTVNP